jgi:hypothetical protein
VPTRTQSSATMLQSHRRTSGRPDAARMRALAALCRHPVRASFAPAEAWRFPGRVGIEPAGCARRASPLTIEPAAKGGEYRGQATQPLKSG